jgi:predicted DNA-binding transcriptional regulator AlpA
MHPREYGYLKAAGLEPGADRRHPSAVKSADLVTGGPIGVDDEVLLTAQQVCKRLGGISQMTLWRWLGSDVVRFPQPTMRVNKRRYWSAGSIRRWLAERQLEGLAA